MQSKKIHPIHQKLDFPAQMRTSSTAMSTVEKSRFIYLRYRYSRWTTITPSTLHPHMRSVYRSIRRLFEFSALRSNIPPVPTATYRIQYKPEPPDLGWWFCATINLRRLTVTNSARSRSEQPIQSTANARGIILKNPSESGFQLPRLNPSWTRSFAPSADFADVAERK